VVILALVCSPVLAISKGKLITYYRTTPVSPVYPNNNPNPAIDAGPKADGSISAVDTRAIHNMDFA
jgi:hypothetical protein